MDRYSRLALFEFADFSKLRNRKVLVIGVGGLGALTSEIMCRCGAGRLAIMDYDVLEEANLNRLIYKTSQVGMAKVDALKEHLTDANPNVDIVPYKCDVTNGKGFESFMREMKGSDLVFGCVDTFHVRMFMNAKCVQARRTLVDGGVSQNGINGSVQVIIPGKTPCYRCNRPLWKEKDIAKAKRRDGSGLCHFTSLPTTMAMISALQAQEGLKLLLGFGKVAPYLMYFGMEGTLKRYDLKRDPRCSICGKVKSGKTGARG